MIAGLALGGAQWMPALWQLPHEVGAQVGGLRLARLVEPRRAGALRDAGGVVPERVRRRRAVRARAARAGATRSCARVLAAAALIAGRGGWPAWAGAPELHVAALVAVIAASAAGGLDGALAGDRRAAQALLIGAGITGVAAVAAAWAHPESAAARDGAVTVVCLVLAAVIAWRARGAWAAPVVLALVLAPSVSALPDVAPTASRAPIDAPSAWASAALAATPTRSDARAPVRVYRPDPVRARATT